MIWAKSRIQAFTLEERWQNWQSHYWSTNFDHQRLNFANSTNLYAFPVRVRRQDSTIENVMLMDEMVAFLDKEMPNAVDNYVAYPHTLSRTRRRSNRFRVSQRRPEPDSQGQLKADQETMSRSWKRSGEKELREILVKQKHSVLCRHFSKVDQVFCQESQWRGFSAPLRRGCWRRQGFIKGSIRGSLGHKIKSKMNAVVSKYDIVQHFQWITKCLKAKMWWRHIQWSLFGMQLTHFEVRDWIWFWMKIKQ